VKSLCKIFEVARKGVGENINMSNLEKEKVIGAVCNQLFLQRMRSEVSIL
jgi:hypothetical protein